MTVTSHGITHPGRVRPDNQDRILILPEAGLYAVLDGMGGQRCGELAAELAAQVLGEYIERSRNPAEVTWPFGYNVELSLDSNRLFTSIRLANRLVTRRSEEDPKCAGMGTTVAAVLCRGNRAAVTNVGDSRIYRFRAGVLEQLSHDDTMTGLLLGRGVITPDVVASHPMRSILTQAIGSQANLDIHSRDEEIAPGDVLLLCSDGLYGAVDEATLTDCLSTADSVEVQVQNLLDRALDAGASDNVSVIVLRYT